MNIISKDFMAETTLAEKVRGGFSRIKVRGSSVKVPELKPKKSKARKPAAKERKVTNSTLINILIRNALENAKMEKSAKKQTKSSRAYRIIEEDEPQITGGYGTVSGIYGSSPPSSYVDYGKLFSYLGKFRSKGGFENFSGDNPTERINTIMEQGNKFYLVDREVIDSGVRSIKYFTSGVLLGELSAVPMGGINSGDWEKFKLWKLVDYVMFNLKMQTM